MISREVLRQLVIRQKARIEQEDGSVRRSILSAVLAAFDDNRVLILSGVRRCGKSTLLRQIMQEKERFCYINFEDERLLAFSADEFEALNEVLIEVYGSAEIYLFDEVQNVDRFETFVRRLQDDGKKVVITGSNASLLSREFGTRLTGRYRLFEVYPFSFAEFLRFRNVALDRNAPYVTEQRAALTAEFRCYAETGGMPEFVRNKDTEYIRTLYENILYRDIIARYAIRRQRLVRELVGILSSAISSPFTYNSLKKSLGLKNAITVKEYIGYLSGGFLFFELTRFDYSLRKQLNAPRKIYVIDPVFSRITGFSLSPDTGRVLENLVYIELRRRGGGIWYFARDRECDFVIRTGRGITAAIQVCHELNPENEEREIGGLLAAMEEFSLPEGTIITTSQEDERKIGGRTVFIRPAWRWLLEGEGV